MTPNLVRRVLGTDDSTPLEFWVAVGLGAHLQLDDVVALDRILPTGAMVSIYGIVGQVRARHEGARFDSDVFLIADGVLPAEVSEAAMVGVRSVYKRFDWRTACQNSATTSVSGSRDRGPSFVFFG